VSTIKRVSINQSHATKGIGPLRISSGCDKKTYMKPSGSSAVILVHSVLATNGSLVFLITYKTDIQRPAYWLCIDQMSARLYLCVVYWLLFPFCAMSVLLLT